MLVTVALQKRDIHPVTPSDARRAWMRHREANGFLSYQPLLTPPSANMKFAKGGVVYGLCLAPARSSGHNVCAFSTPECRRGCVAFAGNGSYPNVMKARISKTQFLVEDPSAFTSLLIHEIEPLNERFGDKLSIRLNTFSDIPWERVHPQVFVPGVRYFDYTKDWSRRSTDNYWLTFSASERTTEDQIIDKTAAGENVAVVFAVRRTEPMPEKYLGVPVVDGDKNDLRDLDPHGIIVGLRGKGSMRSHNKFAMVRRP